VIAPGALKSHEFSESPMKSRILGSAAHARRSAARVNSGGTPGARKARISVSAVVVLVGGSFVYRAQNRAGRSRRRAFAAPRSPRADLELDARFPPPRRAQRKTSLLRRLPPPHACAATSAR